MLFTVLCLLFFISSESYQKYINTWRVPPAGELNDEESDVGDRHPARHTLSGGTSTSCPIALEANKQIY